MSGQWPFWRPESPDGNIIRTTFCHLQGGLPTTDEDELADRLDSGEPLEPWMADYLAHNRDKSCTDCYGGGEDR